ncbi:hypothetical protein G7046_g8064 [Stylonectria norvegica]|nr:hypothetical protein G7046_g8064 [Stylonectria norvegica]
MVVFFLSWELWQEMTFVLACCIVLVFVIGFVKLWWTNRVLRRLELIDEEKRARVSTMSHCVRAIQSGIEVEGIWISRPNTPDDSQVASCTTLIDSTTLVGDQTELAVSKGKGRLSKLSISQTLPIGSVVGAPSPRSHCPPPTRAMKQPLHPPTHISKILEPVQLPTNPDDATHLQNGAQDDGCSSDASAAPKFRNPFTTPSQPPNMGSVTRTSAVRSEADPSITESALYGAVEVVVNSNTRRANRACVVVPAAQSYLVPNNDRTEDSGAGHSGRPQQTARAARLSKRRAIHAKLRKGQTSKIGRLLSDMSSGD